MTVKEEFRAEVGRFLNLVPDAAYPAPQEAQFAGEDDEELDFIEARDLWEIGRRLIEDYAEFEHLRERTVMFLWKRNGGEKHGQAVLGKCVKPSGMVKHFSNADWVIWVAADHCRNYGLTGTQIEAICHHECLHADEKTDKQGNVKLAVRGHDWEGFSQNVQRYGLWQENLKLAAQAFEQGRLFGEG